MNNSSAVVSPSVSRHSTPHQNASTFGVEDEGARICLVNIVGNTVSSSAGFDSVGDVCAVAAGSCVTLARFDADFNLSQKFFTTNPSTHNAPTASCSPSQTIKYMPRPHRTLASGSKSGGYDTTVPGSPLGDMRARKVNTARQRVKAITCVSLSADGKMVAVGEVSRDFYENPSL